MASIAALGPDLTVVVATHRLAALAQCDRILRLEHGRLVQITRRAELAVAAPEGPGAGPAG